MNNLIEFRQKYPFHPYQPVYLRGSDDKVMTPVEVISYPYEEGLDVQVKIRLVPGEPGTLGTTSVDNLIIVPHKVICQRCGNRFEPQIEPYPVAGSHGSKTLMFDCKKCGRGYFLHTAIYEECNGIRPHESKWNRWYSDREIKVIQ